MGQEQAPQPEPLKIDRRQFIQVGAAALTMAFLEGDVTSLALRTDLFLTMLGSPGEPLSEDDEADARLHEHVIPLYNNLITQFSTVGGFFLEHNRSISTQNYSPVWPFSQAMEAIGAARGVPGKVGEDARARFADLTRLLPQYWSNEPAKRRPGYISGLRELTTPKQLERFVDDNLWIALMLLDEYQNPESEGHLNPEYLAEAASIYNLALSEWDFHNGGGIRWMQNLPSQHNGRVVASNAPAVILGVRLALITGNPDYYKREGRPGCPDIMAWMDGALRDPEDGLYWDNINENNDIGHSKWTYNMGTIIGATLWSSRADPEHFSAATALDLAERTLTYFDHKDDEIRAERDPKINDGYIGNALNAILFRNLLALADAMPENIAFRRRVLESLHTRVSRLSHSNNELLEQAGALHLALLAFRNPLDTPDRRAR